MAAGEPIVVQALYTFKRSNNDELCFKKGDVITVTQKDDGWWEGTLDGKTGWFPSNYVKECKDIPQPSVKQDNEYKSVVLKDIIDSERTHVEELEGLLTKYLQPLEKSSLLSQDEFKQLTSNFTEVLETHRQLLLLVEQESAKPGQDQRVGKLYLNWAPKIKAVHQMYCSLHPRAVVILDKFKEELSKYMESRGAVAPGVLVLTTLLSKPFRRLDKYSGLLQELERHLEECHPDRGDTQRSVSIYKDIATTCLATRRQKELELQVLTGPIRGWEGPNLTKLGEIIYMGSVAVGQHHHDRYFVLFPTTLVILSVSHRTSAFIYEGKLFLAGLTVTPLEDTETIKNAFEIGTPMIEKRVVICQSRQEADHWLELLMNSQGSRSSTSSQKVLPSQAQYVPQPPPHMSPLISAQSPNTVPMIPQFGGSRGMSMRCSSPLVSSQKCSTWSATCLRPTPPLRPCLALGATPSGPYQRYNNRKPTSYKEDGLILDVIEAYCLGKPRNTVSSVTVTESIKPELTTKTLSEALSLLHSKYDVLEYKVAALASQLNEEREARIDIQNQLREYLNGGRKKELDCG
ncbi:rho guanine nucleotide exchange factor 7 isoform X2 [Euwallacea similis]|uniref:rho guanine nucleotide exchange factor 7 isoform X2 n=1 Tax=Euwallacea similis TaxID=1736056 RepID=UPI00344FE556